jgi:hypothetical protein
MDPVRLLERIVAHPDPDSLRVGVLQNRLLREYQRGYPLENLLPLLHSNDERSVYTGMFVASELGMKGKPLLNDVFPHLKDPDKWVKGMTLDCILMWAEPSNRVELGSGVAVLDDAEPANRWSAMNYLARLPREKLQVALSYWEATDPKSAHAGGLRWLLGSDASSPERVIAALQDKDRLRRMYGVVAAARVSKLNKEPLLYASRVEDRDVKGFADHWISLLSPPSMEMLREQFRNLMKSRNEKSGSR